MISRSPNRFKTVGLLNPNHPTTKNLNSTKFCRLNSLENSIQGIVNSNPIAKKKEKNYRSHSTEEKKNKKI